MRAPTAGQADQAEGRPRTLRRRLRAAQSRAALFLIAKHPHACGNVADLAAHGDRSRTRVEESRLIGATGGRSAHGAIAIGRFRSHRNLQTWRAKVRNSTDHAPLACAYVERRRAVGAPLHGHDTGQGSGPIGTGTRTPHQGDTGQTIWWQGRPNDPASEGIVLRRTVQSHQRPARTGRRDTPQGNTLNCRVGRVAPRSTK